jgi:hypothetical protein
MLMSLLRHSSCVRSIDIKKKPDNNCNKWFSNNVNVNTETGPFYTGTVSAWYFNFLANVRRVGVKDILLLLLLLLLLRMY